MSSLSSKIVCTAVPQLSPGPNSAKEADSQEVRGGAVGPYNNKYLSNTS